MNWFGHCDSRLLVGAGGSVLGQGLVAQGGVPPVVVIFVLPVADDDAGVGKGAEQVMFRHSSRSQSVECSMPM